MLCEPCLLCFTGVRYISLFACLTLGWVRVEGAGGKPRVRGLLKGVSVGPGKLASLEEAGSRLAEAYKLLDHALRNLGVYGLANVYEGLKGYTEEYTVVYNRAKKPYYYWYLKCTGRDKHAKSIYLGKSPEGYNAVKNAARAASDVAVAVEKLRRVVEELDKALRDLTDKLTQLTTALAAEAARESSALNTA